MTLEDRAILDHIDGLDGPGFERFLADVFSRLGYRVDAWDISDVALERLRAVLAAAGEALDVTPRWADLDDSSIPPATYDLVLDVNFLQRRLFASMAEGLRPGGLLLVRALMRRVPGRRATASAMSDR